MVGASPMSLPAELLEQIKSTQRLPGWCSLAKATRLAELVVELKPDVTVEVGTFAGKSAYPMALAHRFINKGLLICFEPWKNAAAMEGYDGENAKWWSTVDMNAIQLAFIAEWRRLDLVDWIKPVQVRSDDAVPPDNIGLLHLDSQHTEKALMELKKFTPKLTSNGVVVLDDTQWHNNGRYDVLNAEAWLLNHGFKETERVFNKDKGGDDDFAIYGKL